MAQENPGKPHLTQRKEKGETTELKSSARTDIFLKQFSESIDNVKTRLAQSGDLEQDLLANHFDEISRLLQKVQKMVADSASLLPSYDLKRCQDSLRTTEISVHEKMDTFIPRKKFAFKSRRKEGEKQPDTATAPAKHVITQVIDDCGFRSRSGCKLEKGEAEIQNRDVVLDDLEDCEVRLYGNPSTIQATKLRNCRIYTGPVSTSIFLENCTDSEFHVACQQLRIHGSRDCVFRLHVTSKAIIEDCKGMTFSVYDWNYDGLDKHYEQSGLSRDVNNWNKVDDFNWLASDKESPNWTAK